ncbi:hypothetical protein [Thermococcus henrietii]|uniref:hypothetical protein n=1 Tax=Thermococcus henrietii TaxID=2016361 RepID=UPI00131439A5|nr:hypothetical protein [Thermococcus henrietii]
MHRFESQPPGVSNIFGSSHGGTSALRHYQRVHVFEHFIFVGFPAELFQLQAV